MSDLRAQVVEAMELAIYNVEDGVLAQAEAALDAALDILGERREEWQNEANRGLKSLLGPVVRRTDIFTTELLAVLRDSGKETPDG